MKIKELISEIPFTLRVGCDNVPDGDWRETEKYLYKNQKLGLSVKVELTSYDGTGATRQVNTVTNENEKEILLTGFSSSKIHTEHGTVALSQNRWQCEGQWKYFSMETLGVIPSCKHPWDCGAYRISSVGSWATGGASGHYPLTMVLADNGKTYYTEIEGAHNWMLEHSCLGGFDSPCYFLESTAAHEENGGWYKKLMPGESYTTQPAVFGCVDGGFESVIKELLVYKRATSKTSFPDGTIPVVFNDYMNCLWGMPSDEKLLPLIDAAAEAGCEYFCIDAGWHKNADNRETWAYLGDWLVNDEKFGNTGLSGVFEHMKEKGLKPGVWFELDCVNFSARSHDLDDNCLLKRYGEPIPREFFNFKNEKVRKHLASRIDELYGMGVRYIKNDYNKTTGIGCDNYGTSYPQGLIENYEAFCSFIDEVREKHPDLIIENCGSGGCREEHGTLSHFHLQSTSDQEYYMKYPSIITGTYAQMEPEKMGIWSYPMPLRHEEIQTCDFSEKWYSEFSDCEETVFNMVSGMCGVLYQSGRLDKADEKNLLLVKKGIEKYKEIRSEIPQTHPILPTGTHPIYENKIAAAGLESADCMHAYLAVWRIGTKSDTAAIDVSKYGYKKAKAFFPEDAECSLSEGILKVKLPKIYSARMILLEK